ncbi:sulfotransferase family cytosolic 1B member 1-like [Zerene cesonia]|uniref:sulfotransferase family cytosolic 1B member 1-like n=1 Tax=Zerene cesonia TaxID=33412 RepID=UPI0018E55248|nr:sulfotransferase family cytosolic 1B member 1-like [Zerene cesonia]
MSRIPFPFDIKDVEENLAKELMVHYSGEFTGFVQVGPKKYFFPHKYKEEAEDIYNIPVKPDDVYVVTFPRSGTTWTQELVWLVKNDLDFESAKETPLTFRFPYLDISILMHPVLLKPIIEDSIANPSKFHLAEMAKPGVVKVANLKSPRFIKSHLPLSLLPPGLLDTAKVVYVARDPRDAAVSFYYLSKTFGGAPKDFKTYWNYFIRGLHHYLPVFEHVKEAWNMRHHPNLLFLFYEELSKDLPAVIRRVADFLGKEMTQEQVMKLADHLNFSNFKDNASFNNVDFGHPSIVFDQQAPFIRKGKVGGWRDHFDDEMVEQADRWLKENLADTDLRYPAWELTDLFTYCMSSSYLQISISEPCHNQYLDGELTGFVQVGPKKYFFPHKYKEEAEDIYNIPVKPDDVYVVTFPRSVYLLLKFQDLPAVIRRVADFLGKEMTQEQVMKLADHLNFSNFKDNTSVNNVHLRNPSFVVDGEAPFLRKGKVGGWRDHFDDEMVEQADRWFKENLADTDLRYPARELTDL